LGGGGGLQPFCFLPVNKEEYSFFKLKFRAHKQQRQYFPIYFPHPVWRKLGRVYL
jgi:hypothetical protein